ncbi:Putative esterase [Planococcus glaciei]|uniref:alpha/beta hydrolase n=1 Tax=Planococcus glaciei TaxID=459472 RepID=UPI0008824260|nr:alpha/beta hydrolase-fold protein [Planococcus glaciei]SDI65075.1 Putative esterase [Planococcus glaciei]
MNEGAVANITDNLIAGGKAEPFVVVTMNNQDLNWDYKRIEVDQFEHIMPYVEANYNVSDEPAGRAYAGLSMGGVTANRMYFNHADDFAYFGIWSYAVTGDELNNIGSYRNLDDPSVMVGVGIWDYLIDPVQNLHTALNEEGIEHAYVEVPAAHDWKAWHLLYAAFVEDHLWKKKDKRKAKEE